MLLLIGIVVNMILACICIDSKGNKQDEDEILFRENLYHLINRCHIILYVCLINNNNNNNNNNSPAQSYLVKVSVSRKFILTNMDANSS